MAAKSSPSHCGTRTLANTRRRPSFELRRSETQTRNHSVSQNHGLALSGQQMGRESPISNQDWKYWLAASCLINVLCLSRLVCFERPATHSMKDGVSEDGGHAYVNGAGKPHSIVSSHFCSDNGYFQHEGVDGGWCKCHACFTGSTCAELLDDCIVNFDHGDPKMFQTYWSSEQNAVSTVLSGVDRMSYFSDTDGICWFLERSLASEINLMHKMVGNAITDGYHIIVGTGSSQLISAALYAISLSSSQGPVDVVSAVPYYSSYPPMTDFLKSQLHRWAGDALNYEWDGQRMYIELVTSPGNPDGKPHSTVVNGTGSVIHDLAYYWPHYAPITYAADYDIMLFTVSKATGHAGTRIGWALVHDPEIAKRMTKYIELSTIGVSKDSQFRASQILKAIRTSYSQAEEVSASVDKRTSPTGFFDFGYKKMYSRWEQLRHAVRSNKCYSLEEFGSGYCNFSGSVTSSHPAFAWLRCEKDDDCYQVFKAHGILTRSGTHFGSSSKYVRISMVDHDGAYKVFINRLQQMADACHLKYYHEDNTL